ncbi:hypothetical protein [Rhodovulum kholense]|uniref:hypothetical protein n=1 Tax=Rhodovulum kholense TaxID=453584 RepID=UPI003CCBACA3
MDPGAFCENPFTDIHEIGIAGLFGPDQAAEIIKIVKDVNRSAAAQSSELAALEVRCKQNDQRNRGWSNRCFHQERRPRPLVEAILPFTARAVPTTGQASSSASQ